MFEFLKFLRDGLQNIPNEIIEGSLGQQIFHLPGEEKLWWSVEVDFDQPYPVRYQGELIGPIGRTQVTFERVVTAPPQEVNPYTFMDIKNRRGVIREGVSKKLKKQDIAVAPNQLALGTVTDLSMVTLRNLRDYIRSWRFYSSFNIANHKIRQPVFIEEQPVLQEDAGNLSSVLHYLMTEHQQIFNDLQQILRSIVPGFKSLNVKSRGGRGQVLAFWQEAGIDDELSLADLSDGILRLLCWLVLSMQPNPPSLICIDEPDQGVHPRTLPVLADLFEKATGRTQILLATHASYFLRQFDISQIAVMRKENGEAKFIKPGDSGILVEMLEDFGADEIENLHRSDELELLS